MGNTWISDLRHFLDEDGELVDFPGRPLAKHFCRIVEAVTSALGTNVPDTGVPCRRRPGRRPCRGLIRAGLENDFKTIGWDCPECGDNGWISGWQDTQWDRLAAELEAEPDIHRISHRGGMIEKLEDRASLPWISLEGPALSSEIVDAVSDSGLLGISGVFGDAEVGEPIQYDELKIEHTEGTDRIVVFNRAIMLVQTSDLLIVGFHRVVGVVTNAVR